MTPTFDVHDSVNQAHAIRGAYLGQLLKSSLKALHGALTLHKGVAHGQTSAAA